MPWYYKRFVSPKTYKMVTAGAKSTKKVAKSRADAAVDVAVLKNLGKDKSPKLRDSGQANVRTTTEMRTCTEVAEVTMTDGALTALALVQLNSAYEPVDTEAEQPRGFDQFTTWYKRYRVWSCAIQCFFSGTRLHAYGKHYKPIIFGITAHMSGENPTTLREAMENPRTVYKVMYPNGLDYQEGTPADQYVNTAECHGSIEGIFDPAEVFGNKDAYRTLDDVAGYSTSNPSVLLNATIWVGQINAAAGDTWYFNPVVMTNQKLTWFGAEKLSSS